MSEGILSMTLEDMASLSSKPFKIFINDGVVVSKTLTYPAIVEDDTICNITCFSKEQHGTGILRIPKRVLDECGYDFFHPPAVEGLKVKAIGDYEFINIFERVDTPYTSNRFCCLVHKLEVSLGGEVDNMMANLLHVTVGPIYNLREGNTRAKIYVDLNDSDSAELVSADEDDEDEQAHRFSGATQFERRGTQKTRQTEEKEEDAFLFDQNDEEDDDSDGQGNPVSEMTEEEQMALAIEMSREDARKRQFQQGQEGDEIGESSKARNTGGDYGVNFDWGELEAFQKGDEFAILGEKVDNDDDDNSLVEFVDEHLRLHQLLDTEESMDLNQDFATQGVPGKPKEVKGKGRATALGPIKGKGKERMGGSGFKRLAAVQVTSKQAAKKMVADIESEDEDEGVGMLPILGRQKKSVLAKKSSVEADETATGTRTRSRTRSPEAPSKPVDSTLITESYNQDEDIQLRSSPYPAVSPSPSPSTSSITSTGRRRMIIPKKIKDLMKKKGSVEAKKKAIEKKEKGDDKNPEGEPSSQTSESSTGQLRRSSRLMKK